MKVSPSTAALPRLAPKVEWVCSPRPALPPPHRHLPCPSHSSHGYMGPQLSCGFPPVCPAAILTPMGALGLFFLWLPSGEQTWLFLCLVGEVTCMVGTRDRGSLGIEFETKGCHEVPGFSPCCSRTRAEGRHGKGPTLSLLNSGPHPSPPPTASCKGTSCMRKLAFGLSISCRS